MHVVRILVTYRVSSPLAFWTSARWWHLVLVSREFHEYVAPSLQYLHHLLANQLRGAVRMIVLDLNFFGARKCHTRACRLVWTCEYDCLRSAILSPILTSPTRWASSSFRVLSCYASMLTNQKMMTRHWDATTTACTPQFFSQVNTKNSNKKYCCYLRYIHHRQQHLLTPHLLLVRTPYYVRFGTSDLFRFIKIFL